jgi:twitching motility protein PilT
MNVLVTLAPQRAPVVLQPVFTVGTAADKLAAIQHLAQPQVAGPAHAAVVKALAAALNDPAEAVVAQAVGALARVASEEEYAAEVVPLAESREIAVARAALQGLASYPSTRTMAILQRKLRQGPNALRFTVVDALEAMGTAEVLKPLLEALSHSQLVVRVRAANALSRLGGAGKLDLARTIVFLLRNADLNIRRMAVELAHSVPDKDDLWPKLLGYLRDEDWWIRERVADAILDVAGKAVLPHVVALLDDRSELIRRLAVDMLVRLKDPDSLGAVVRTAQADTDWWVRERAIEAMAALKDARAVPYILDIMLRTADLQVACLEALGALASPEAGPQVATLLTSPDADVRRAALACLGKLGGPAQATAVRGLLNDASGDVRVAARQVLTRWAMSAEEPVERELNMLDQLLVAMVKREGDDLIVAPGRRPYYKRFGKTLPLARNVLSAPWLASTLTRLLSFRQQEDLQRRGDVDFSYELQSEKLRFRANVYRQVGGMAAVFRLVRRVVPDLDSLGLPPVVQSLATLKNGLVLVGGPTGAGKSTTLAALVDHVNRTSARHIITLEDPIEYEHRRKLSLVNQREIGTHTASFESALRATLRQDPNVLLVGEMRDRPTISFAVTAAETGHLVFGTIHTVSAALTVDRLINAFPPGQQDEVRAILAGSLRAVVCQFLHPRRDASGRCLSVEVMLNNEAIANLIRKGKTFQIATQIATSRAAGMQLMDGELMRLYNEGKISAEDAYMKAASKKDFEALMQGKA